MLANSHLRPPFENTVAEAYGVYAALRKKRRSSPIYRRSHGFRFIDFPAAAVRRPDHQFHGVFLSPVTGEDLGYRPEVPRTEIQALRSQNKNAMVLLDLANCDRAWTPTHYQRDFFPERVP